MAEFILNGRAASIDAEAEMPLLWVLRDVLGLTGTKFGCGIAQCGACTVHVDGEAQRACMLPLAAVAGRAVTTIEGLGAGGPHPVQQAWIAEDVPQCGYCQSGQIMAVVALLAREPRPDAATVAATVDNICRCGTYPRLLRAVTRAPELLTGKAG
ncbi:MAG: (2Fe-2S)-binding protein [Alphaproteobacteria bacterium]|nr:(2Fe-2S)-binding protein [Alphaproteobacteria bacterium]